MEAPLPASAPGANGAASPPASNGTQPSGMSADEIAQYDRQIRLWGMHAQEKIRKAKVLLITMKALANEIAKNLVLAGIASLTVVDHDNVTEADLGPQFFLSAEDNHLGMNRAQAASAQIRKLNPRVAVHVVSEDIRQMDLSSLVAAHDVIIATDLDPDTISLLNAATRLQGRPFYAAGTHGLYGFIFTDLIEHSYVIRRDKANVPTELKAETPTRAVVAVRSGKEDGRVVEMVTKREQYSPWPFASEAAQLPAEYTKSSRRLKAVTPALSCLRALWDFHHHHGRLPGHTRDDLQHFTRVATIKHAALRLPAGTLRSEFLRSFLQNIGGEMAPVTAVLGGQLAQDVINMLGGLQQPIQNMVVFDGNTMEANMYPLHPEGPLGVSLSSSIAPAVEVMGQAS